MLSTICKYNLLAIGLASSGALAHMQMLYPPTLMGKYNDLIPSGDKDWNPQNPLEPDGSNYPCRGWIGKDTNNVGTLQAGKSMNFTLIGTTPGAYVPHGGGSCQVALSYDSGKTWSTIWSYMGGCVLDKTTYDVAIPADAPSGDVLFAWSWFNRMGNREMYQNCALMTITGGGAGLTDKKAYPPPFVANVGNGCATEENVDTVFPSPGKNVFWGGAYASSRPTAPAGIKGTNCVPPGQQDAGPYQGSAGPDPAPSSSASLAVNPPTTTTSSASKAAANTQALLSPPSAATSSSVVSSSSSTSSSAAAAATAPAKQCRRRKRSVIKRTANESDLIAPSPQRHRAHGGIERKHERLVRKRVAALPAGRP